MELGQIGIFLSHKGCLDDLLAGAKELLEFTRGINECHCHQNRLLAKERTEFWKTEVQFYVFPFSVMVLSERVVEGMPILR